MILIKIGGGKSINAAGIIGDLASIHEPFIIVHGANGYRDTLARDLKIQKRIVTSISGYDSVYSDRNAIDLLLMAYAGLRNKRIVEICLQNGINAVGLTGLDGALIRGKRNRGIKTIQEGKKMILRDLSGKPRSINRDFLELLLNNGYTPVITVPIIDGENQAVNSENDDILSLLHKEFHAGKIFQFIEAPGFLKEPADPDSLIKKMNPEELSNWEESVSGRIKRKLKALKKLMDTESPKIHIADGRVAHPLAAAMAGHGTVIS